MRRNGELMLGVPNRLAAEIRPDSSPHNPGRAGTVDTTVAPRPRRRPSKSGSAVARTQQQGNRAGCSTCGTASVSFRRSAPPWKTVTLTGGHEVRVADCAVWSLCRFSAQIADRQRPLLIYGSASSALEAIQPDCEARLIDDSTKHRARTGALIRWVVREANSRPGRLRDDTGLELVLNDRRLVEGLLQKLDRMPHLSARDVSDLLAT